MSQTPYEIRLELLKMAKEIVEHNWHAVKEKLMLDWHQAVDLAKETRQPVPPHPEIVPMHQSEIMAVAQQLNSFIANKN